MKKVWPTDRGQVLPHGKELKDDKECIQWTRTDDENETT